MRGKREIPPQRLQKAVWWCINSKSHHGSYFCKKQTAVLFVTGDFFCVQATLIGTHVGSSNRLISQDIESCNYWAMLQASCSYNNMSLWVIFVRNKRPQKCAFIVKHPVTVMQPDIFFLELYYITEKHMWTNKSTWKKAQFKGKTYENTLIMWDNHKQWSYKKYHGWKNI